MGKSSLLNAITRQDVSIVSDFAGTTTDPVEKPMELLPLGPVLFIDTAGVDDDGALGEARVERTHRVLDRTDLALLVAETGAWSRFEEDLLAEFLRHKIPALAVLNKCDLAPADDALLARLAGRSIPVVQTAAPSGRGLPELRRALLDLAPADFVDARSILSDLVGPGETAILVVPIDKGS